MRPCVDPTAVDSPVAPARIVPVATTARATNVPAARVSPAAIAMIAAIAPSVETIGAMTPTFPIRRAE